MAAGGKRASAADRVLEGRHVIGLFLLMLLFSGVFFTLGYVMGRNQFGGQVRAEPTRDLTSAAAPQSHANPTDITTNSDSSGDAVTPPSSDWEFYRAGEKKLAKNRLETAPSAKSIVASGRNARQPKATAAVAHARIGSPAMARGSYSLQVAALTREADAMALATNLQKKRFPAFVLSAQGDKFYRVQVGPYADLKSADAAKKGLESAGFKAIVKH